jgi:hypothetical protein
MGFKEVLPVEFFNTPLEQVFHSPVNLTKKLGKRKENKGKNLEIRLDRQVPATAMHASFVDHFADNQGQLLGN